MAGVVEESVGDDFVEELLELEGLTVQGDVVFLNVAGVGRGVGLVFELLYA